MRTNRIYGLCALQLIGLGVQVINKSISLSLS